MTDTREKRVTWAELFFDLVLVFAITQVSELLHDQHTWAGVGQALIVFMPVYWAWVGTTVHANLHDVENPTDRLGLGALALCALFMALALPEAYGPRGMLFAGAYVALRVLLAALYLRGRQTFIVTPQIAVCVTGPLMLAGGLAPMPWRTLLWALVALVDLAAPRVLRSRMIRTAFDPGHLVERFGLFLMIALGESVVGIGATAAHLEHLSAAVVLAVTAAFALACALWWVYFVYASSAMRYAVATAEIKTDVIRPVLTWGHLAFVAAVVAVAVGLTEVVAHPGRPLGPGAAAFLFGGTGLYLATFGYTRYRMFRTWSTTRLSTAVVVLALLPVALLVPALAALLVLATLVAGLNLLEHLIVTRRALRSGTPTGPEPRPST
ncbi:low temperature requirement protein A [Micromonospora zhanjiangensis]|uniref:Low temperature requirement protein A n=1 Tax=Micromonospora zhanjiangensis TaxID=1522057 RepID=A0ABV8KGA6_9ACTN